MDATADLRVALVGYGYWGPNLARNLHLRLGPGFVACADRDPARLAEVARRYPWVREVPDAAALLEDPAVDAVVVATPARSHAALVQAALAAGKHVLVEKPLALSTVEAVALAQAATAARRGLLGGPTLEDKPAGG